MEVFITDINEISKCRLRIDEYVKRLSVVDLNRYKSIQSNQKKLQFLVGRMLLYDNLGSVFSINVDGSITSDKKFISVSHSKDFVALALSNFPVGIDIEYLNSNRNIKKIAEFMNFSECANIIDFYSQFTRYEANYKSHIKSNDIKNLYFEFNNYILCIAHQFSKEDISIYKSIPYEVNQQFDSLREIIY